MDKNFYITTTLPYVNSSPHIGFAMEIIRADVFARHMESLGYSVFFNTGTDEHGQKIWTKAQEEGKDTQGYVDEFAEKFKNLKDLLDISPNIHFTRTTDKHHISSAQAFWKIVEKNGYIYKKNYQTKYCVGCELEKTDSELVNGECPVHPGKPVELRDEENYFFKFSAFQEKLLAYYNANPDFVVPSFRFNEIRSFVERGLEDFSISRLAEKMSWGTPVPHDEEHVMYVWFDALVNYISCLGWPKNIEDFEKYWVNGTPTQYCGKDNLRQQSAMWQAMLLAAELPMSKRIIVNGFINVGGQKMSKSIGNIVNPYDVVAEYGKEALRYYVTRELNTFEDSDYTAEKFKESYNAGLANGLGNLVSRVLKMSTTYFNGEVAEIVPGGLPMKNTFPEAGGSVEIEGWPLSYYIEQNITPKYNKGFETFDLRESMDAVWDLVATLDKYVTDYEPYKLIKIDAEKTKAVIWTLLYGISEISKMLTPFMPETSDKIKNLLGATYENNGESISFKTGVLEKPLFMRKD